MPHCRVVALSFVLLLLSTLGSGVLAQPNPPLEGFVGTIAVTQDSFDAQAAAGLHSIRAALFWNYLPPSGYGANLWAVDQDVAAASARGFEVYLIINPPNNPASAGWRPPNVAPNTYQTFLRVTEDAAFRYGDRVAFWEIGNEVNQSFENLSVHYPGYPFAVLLRDSYFALLRGFQRRGDYAAIVARRGGVGFKMYPAGTAGTDLVWLHDVCRGLENQYDLHPGEGTYVAGFSIHPFSSPHSPDDAVLFDSPGTPKVRISHGTLLQNIDWAKAALFSYPRVPKELFLGEYGWSTSHPADPNNQVTPGQQARYVAQGYLEAHASGKVSQAIWAWTFRDLPHGTWSFWDHTGALNEDGSPKPAYNALKTLIQTLRGLSLQQNLGWMLPNGRMYLYRSGTRRVVAFWNAPNVRVRFRIAAGATARLLDLYGNPIQEYPAGQLAMEPFAAADPKYLEVTGGAVTEINGIALTAAGEPVLPGMTASPVTWSRASSSASGSSPSNAFDGDLTTWWSAGQFAPGWVEVKLYGAQTVKGIVLYPAQLPSGPVDHRIDLAINHGPYQQVHALATYAADGTKIVVELPQTYTNVTHLRVRTLASPSWVAWKEIQAFR